MSIHRPFARSRPPGLSLFLLICLMGLLWLAGGASRADVAGQAIVRGGAAVLMVAALLFIRRPWAGSAKPALWLLLASVALVAAQLVPLPPGLWQSLPGRALFTQAVSGEQPWRPVSIVPDGTVNALLSLLVPLAALCLTAGLEPGDRSRLPIIVLGLISASMLLGLLQFSGVSFRNPLLNSASDVSGSFTNRNHFALLMAMGCMVAPAWAFPSKHEPAWRGLVALGLVVLFLLLILASGSRVGMMLGGIAILFGLSFAYPGIKQALRHAPRWAHLAFIAGMAMALAGFVALSIATDRAKSIGRVLDLDSEQDMRLRALPKLVEMLTGYLPWGTGFGSFDQAFRMNEPFDLLKLTYFNHAHNDFLEVVLDGGLPALLLTVAALGWWIFAGIRVWRRAPSPAIVQGRLGWAMLALVLVASAFDYPARTPMMMALIMVSSVWLCWGSSAIERSTLPRNATDL